MKVYGFHETRGLLGGYKPIRERDFGREKWTNMWLYVQDKNHSADTHRSIWNGIKREITSRPVTDLMIALRRPQGKFIIHLIIMWTSPMVILVDIIRVFGVISEN